MQNLAKTHNVSGTNFVVRPIARRGQHFRALTSSGTWIRSSSSSRTYKKSAIESRWRTSVEIIATRHAVDASHATQAAGVKEKYLRYERLDSNHSLLDGVREWLLAVWKSTSASKAP